MTNTIEIIQQNQCCACYACVNACPQKCITMGKSGGGALYPHIRESKCIKCGKCLSVCPAAHDIQKNVPEYVYATFSKDESVRRASTSGGLATTIAKKVISYGGVAYGAALIESEIRHIRVSSEHDVQKIQGSKYVHSHMKDIYRQIDDDIRHHVPIVFIGTPCQVAGVKQYLKVIPGNLFSIDILCHGVTSLDCFANGLRLETNKKVSQITFRDGNRYCLQGYDESGECIFSTPYKASYWYNGFVEGYLFRENCYTCKYAGKERIGDITIGDFWGLQNSFDVCNGVNFAAVNTEKGKKLWSLVQEDLEFEVRCLEEEIPFNHSLSRPANKPNGYEKFNNIYKAMGAKAALMLAYPKKAVFVMIRRIVRKHKRFYSFIINIPIIGNKLSDYPK